MPQLVYGLISGVDDSVKLSLFLWSDERVASDVPGVGIAVFVFEWQGSN